LGRYVIKREKATEGWRKLHVKDAHNLYSSPKIEEDEINGACGM
jgi:hypothetical protein